MTFRHISGLLVAAAAMALYTVPVQAKDASTDTGFSAIQTAFQKYCAEPFPDAAAFRTRVESSDSGFGLVEKSGDQSRQPGDQWTNGFITLSYVDADWMPLNMPSPQCRVTAHLDEALDHLNTAQRLSVEMELGKGRSSGRANVNKTIWNYQSPTGETVRVFFDSKPARNGGYDISLLMVRLRNNNN